MKLNRKFLDALAPRRAVKDAEKACASWLRVLGCLLLLCLMPASCGSRKHVRGTDDTTGAADPAVPSVQAESHSTDTGQPADTRRQEEECVTARMRLELSSGPKEASIGGTLRMKRDDVIQVSLVTFGILEVARIEMTSDYLMVIDRMGKRYVKAAYGDVALLKGANVDFRTIQAYFWNEQTPRHLAWERTGLVQLGERSLPTRHVITTGSGSKTAKATLTLSNLQADSDWEKRTSVPARYAQVPVDELLSRIMNLSL